MAAFPMFVNLTGRKCIVVGGGNVAERKIETLLAFGAAVVVVSPEITEKLQQYRQENRITVVGRPYEAEDMEGAFLAVAATSQRTINEKVYLDASTRGIPVNVADNPKNCTFIFPSVVMRGDLIIGISTSGGYPGLSKGVRQKIEEIIPDHYGDLLELLKGCRERALKEVASPAVRKELMAKLAEEVLLSEDIPDERQFRVKIENIFGEYRDEKGN